jgi:hypothetical protein
VVTVKRIDRLARSTFDLFAIVKRIADGLWFLRRLSWGLGRSWLSRGSFFWCSLCRPFSPSQRCELYLKSSLTVAFLSNFRSTVRGK